jgi:hypothetical protein
MVRWLTNFEFRHQSWTYIVAPVRALPQQKDRILPIGGLVC